MMSGSSPEMWGAAQLTSASHASLEPVCPRHLVSRLAPHQATPPSSPLHSPQKLLTDVLQNQSSSRPDLPFQPSSSSASLPSFTKDDLESLMELGGMSPLAASAPGLSEAQQAQWQLYQSIKVQYPWLEYQVQRNVAFCSLCRKYNQPNCAFSQLQADEIREHACMPSHRKSEKLLTEEWLLNLESKVSTSKSGILSDGSHLAGNQSDNSPAMEDQSSQVSGDLSNGKDREEEVETARTSDTTNSSPEGDLSYDKKRRRFCHHWFTLFPWLIYDQATHRMFCRICLKFAGNTSTSFVAGSSSFKKCTLKAHDVCEIHRNALYRARKCDPDLAQMGGSYAHQTLFDMPPLQPAATTTSAVPLTVDNTFQSLTPDALQKFSHLFTPQMQQSISAMQERYIKALSGAKTTLTVNMACSLDQQPALWKATPATTSPSLCVNYPEGQHTVPENNNNNVDKDGIHEAKDMMQESNHDLDLGTEQQHNSLRTRSTESVEELGQDNSINSQNSENLLETCREDDCFRKEWLDCYPWLLYDDLNHLMYCKACILVHRESQDELVSGCKRMEEELLGLHHVSSSHQEAMEGTMLEAMDTEEEEEDKCEAAGKLTTSVDKHSTRTLEIPNITNRERFLVNKYLQFFPWLIYNEQVNVLVCDVCQRHGTNTLYVEVRSELEYSVLRSHVESRRHQLAEEAEVSSWSMMWDQAEADGVPVSEQDMTGAPLCKASPPVNAAVNPSGRCDSVSSGTIPYGRSPSETSQTVPGSSEGGFTGLTGDSPFHLQKAMGSPLDIPCPGKYTDIVHGSKKSTYVPKKNNIIPAFGKFKPVWLYEFPWLIYDPDKNIMKCMYCMKHEKKTTFSRGVRIFSRSCILYHSRTAKHVDAVHKEGFEVDEETLRKMKIKRNPHYMMKRLRKHKLGPVEDTLAKKIKKESNSSSDSQNSTEVNGLPIKTEPEEAEGEDGQSDVEQTPAGDSSLTHIASPEEKKPPDKVRERRFLKHWLTIFPWLIYQEEGNVMYCRTCIKHRPGTVGTFVRGSRTFRITSIQVHASCREHQLAERMERLSSAHFATTSVAHLGAAE